MVRNIKTILWYEINDLSHFILWITYYTITSLKFGFPCFVTLIQTREMFRDLIKMEKNASVFSFSKDELTILTVIFIIIID